MERTRPWRGLAAAALLLATLPLAAATLELTILDDGGRPLEGVNVRRLDAPGGAASGLDGVARLELGDSGSVDLEASRLGYRSARLTMLEPEGGWAARRLVLKAERVELAPLTVQGAAAGGLDVAGPRAVERILVGPAAALGACGSARGALGASPGADTRPCALCGSSGVGLQGLDPSYTEVRLDGLSTLSGVGALYGLDGVALSSLERLELERGAVDASAGGGAMAGRVELTSRRGTGDTLGLNLALGDGWRSGAGLLLGRRLGAVPALLTLDWQADPQRLDRDGDRLTDTPQLRRIGGQLGLSGRLGAAAWGAHLSGLGEERFAGDVGWEEGDRGSATVYGREIRSRRGELRLTVDGDWRESRRWTAGLGLTAHGQRSWYGPTRFDADQRRLVARLARESETAAGARVRLEAGFVADDYADGLDLPVSTDRRDRVPSLSLDRRSAPGLLEWDAGLRLERLDGRWWPLLRGAASRALGESLRLRASLGQGLRAVTLFSLDKAVHAGFDDVELPRGLEPERSLSANLGLGGRWLLATGRLDADLSLYAVEFREKAVLRYTETVGRLVYGNADRAFSRGVEGRLDWSGWSGWQASAGFGAGRVRVELPGGWADDEMSSDWNAGARFGKRGLGSLPALSADLRLRAFGPQTLPEGRGRERSPAWATWDLGLGWQGAGWRLGLDVENLFDWVQPDDPLVAGADGTVFDAALIYGPLAGRRVSLRLDVGF